MSRLSVRPRGTGCRTRAGGGRAAWIGRAAKAETLSYSDAAWHSCVGGSRPIAADALGSCGLIGLPPVELGGCDRLDDTVVLDVLAPESVVGVRSALTRLVHEAGAAEHRDEPVLSVRLPGGEKQLPGAVNRCRAAPSSRSPRWASLWRSPWPCERSAWRCLDTAHVATGRRRCRRSASDLRAQCLQSRRGVIRTRDLLLRREGPRTSSRETLRQINDLARWARAVRNRRERGLS